MAVCAHCEEYFKRKTKYTRLCPECYDYSKLNKRTDTKNRLFTIEEIKRKMAWVHNDKGVDE